MVSSFSHHLFPSSIPDGWYGDHPVKLISHFSPKPIFTSEWFQFYGRKQRANESVAEFLAYLCMALHGSPSIVSLAIFLRKPCGTGLHTKAIQRLWRPRETLQTRERKYARTRERKYARIRERKYAQTQEGRRTDGIDCNNNTGYGTSTVKSCTWNNGYQHLYRLPDWLLLFLEDLYTRILSNACVIYVHGLNRRY